MALLGKHAGLLIQLLGDVLAEALHLAAARQLSGSWRTSPRGRYGRQRLPLGLPALALGRVGRPEPL